MGILIRTTFTALAGIVLLTVQCSVDAPTAPSAENCAISITASARAVRPDELVITLGDKTGKEWKQVVNPVVENGSVFFPGVPWGPVVVDIAGKVQGVRTLYGHSDYDVGASNALVKVHMRGILAAKSLDPAQEQQFLQNAGGRSGFWGGISREQTILCSAPDGRASLLTAVGSSHQFLYFLFEVTDSTQFADIRPFDGSGELTSDAVIMYVGKIAPHLLSLEKQPFPAARFQCEVGKPIQENGVYNFVNFATGATRNGVIRDLGDLDITARLLPLGPGSRVLEVRIRKGMLALPEISGQFGLVVRYRNIFNVALGAQLSDWQTGAGDNDPRTSDASWGYLEIYP